MNCECRNSAPNSMNGIGKTCEGSTGTGFAGEPFCWINSNKKHACTDAQKDNSHFEAGVIGDSESNSWYSTMPCISMQFRVFHDTYCKKFSCKMIYVNLKQKTIISL